jgi:hypothetical protein
MAGRLYAATLQKEIHGYTLPKVKDLFKKLHKLKLMKKLDYTFEEWVGVKKAKHKDAIAKKQLFSKIQEIKDRENKF